MWIQQNQPDSSLPSACPSASAPSSPNDVLEALEQRRAKYLEAINQAKANGDDRKARMHERISKVIVEPCLHLYSFYLQWPSTVWGQK